MTKSIDLYVTVTILSAPQKGLRFRFFKPVIKLGREPENDIPLQLDPTVSSHHATLLAEGDKWFLKDEASKNGTRVLSDEGREKVVDKIPIAPGQVFALGRTVLRFDGHERDTLPGDPLESTVKVEE